MNPGLQVTVHTQLYLLLLHVVTAFAVAFGSKHSTAENTCSWSCTLTGANLAEVQPPVFDKENKQTCHPKTCPCTER